MTVARLQVNDFRNLSNQVITFDPYFNFIIGDNGSGKSSLLESIFYIGHGKSFRTHKVEHLSKQGTSCFSINVKSIDGNNLGISKNLLNAQTLIKLNGDKLVKLSDLARNIAVQVITPESFRFFLGGPGERRKFFDLGLFHVKHEFSFLWKDFSRVLKQRNAALKQNVDEQYLSYWTEMFCELSETVSKIRSEYIYLFKNELAVWLNVLLPSLNETIKVEYHQGWSDNKSLAEYLNRNKEREKKQGFSLYGAHKFDVKFSIANENIENKLSRGQQKLFLLALTFTQAKLIEKVERVKPILLIDDIGAELDVTSRTKLYNAITLLNCQVIITAIDKMALEPLVPTKIKYKVFHVEHGNIKEVNRLIYDN